MKSFNTIKPDAIELDLPQNNFELFLLLNSIDCNCSGNHSKTFAPLYNTFDHAGFLYEPRTILHCKVKQTPDIITLVITLASNLSNMFERFIQAAKLYLNQCDYINFSLLDNNTITISFSN
jgi:hypothetical protein